MDFVVCSPLRIQNQAKPDECTSCALSAIAEDTLKQPVDPAYIYANSTDGTFGVTPTVALDAVIGKGVIIEGNSSSVKYPFTGSRSALPWAFRFDSIVRMLKRNNCSFFCGMEWQDNWSSSTTGIMEMPPQWLTWFNHAFKIFGVKEINGIMYLMVQNSMGTSRGDGGIWYMPREIANKLDFAYQPY